MGKVLVDSLFIRQLQSDVTYMKEFIKYHTNTRLSKWMSEELVCEELGWTPKHLRKINNEKQLFTTRKLGKNLQYYREDVQQYQDSQIVIIGRNSNFLIHKKQA